MKIHFDTIAGKNIEIIGYLSDSIVKFKFKNLDYDIKKELWAEYEKAMNQVIGSNKKYLDREIISKEYEALGNRDELMRLNLNHCSDADFYFTNGQKIVSALRKGEYYELGIHNYASFKSYFPPLSNFYKFSLDSFKLKSYKTLEQINANVTAVLSNISIKRIQVGNDFLEIHQILSFTYHIRYKDETYRINTSYPNKSLDSQFENLLNRLNLTNAKCCINCDFFEPITAGHLTNSKLNGHCKKMKEKLPELKKTTTNMWNWCHEFEEISNKYSA